MFKIRGKVQKGLGESKNTLREQMPYFRECYPEVAQCHPATINILLEKPLVVITPDFTTPPLPWHPAFKVVKGGEIFQFVKISLSVEGKPPVPAWIYKAQFSPYRQNPFYIEVLTQQLNFSGAPSCEITLTTQGYEGFVVIGTADREGNSDKKSKPVP